MLALYKACSVQSGALLWQMIRRDIAMRYRGSALGMGWALLQPLMMLLVYTYVFAFVFRARWPQAGDAEAGSPTDFALILYAGLVIHSFIAEILSRAPHIIVIQPHLVKKVVFPLGILPVMMTLSALFQLFISLGLLLLGYMLLHGLPPLTVVALVPIIMISVILAIGVAFILAAFGVYLRDIAQMTGLLSMMLMFLSPIFYPASALPLEWQRYLYLNPLTTLIESTRGAILWGQWPDWQALGLVGLFGLVLCVLGVRIFTWLRRGFADIL